ncbi:MAG: hypothetical protein ACYCYI_11640 [Saccharofermentanales bacterium]
MKKYISSTMAILISMLFLIPAFSHAAIQAGTGVYPPLWSPIWVAEGTTGMWQGFYMSENENVMKYDIFEVGGGNWKAPGDDAAVIWEGNTNVMIPSGKTDVGYVFNALEPGKVEFTMAFKLENPGSTDVEIAVYQNDFNRKIYPTDANSIVAKYNISHNVKFTVDLSKNEKVIFRFHSPAKVAVSNQIRFTAMQAVYKSIGAVSGTTSSISGSSDSNIPMATKFDDIKINAATSTITLSKRLTAEELIDSFILNNGHTIELLLSDGTVAEDMDQIVSDGMQIRIYKLRSEIVGEFKVIAPKIQIVSEPDNTWIYFVIPIALILLALIFFISWKLIKNKNKNKTKINI